MPSPRAAVAHHVRPVSLVLMLGVALTTPRAGDGQVTEAYDVAILGGRVVDPETGFDGVANVGIRGGRIAAVTNAAISGDRTIDASGLVVAPGFIDPLTSMGAARMPSALYKVTDGVTTVLALHGGPVEVAATYDAMEAEGALLNYGTNVGHGALRQAVGLTAADEEERGVAASPEQIDRIVELARQGIMDGALGIGFGLQYVPSTSEEEVFRLLGSRGARLYVIGAGDTSRLEPSAVRHLGVVPYEESWNYMAHAHVGVSLVEGAFRHNNESTKTYHHLRAGLPMVGEAGFPNDDVVRESGIGVVVDNGDLEGMADRVVELAAEPPGSEAAVRDILEHHTWDVRAAIYDEVIRAEGL